MNAPYPKPSGTHAKPDPVELGSFSFTEANLAKAEAHIAKYPERRSAVMPLLTLAQQQNGGWLPKEAMDYVARMLGMPPIRVYEVATFYTMYNLEPVGRHHVQVCTTTPCWLRGSDAILQAAQMKLGVKCGQSTADGQFTLSEAECLGACVNAPMLQVTTPEWDRYYEDLTPHMTQELLGQLARGEAPEEGPVIDRQTSAPVTGLTSLQEVKKPRSKSVPQPQIDTGEPSTRVKKQTKNEEGPGPGHDTGGAKRYLKETSDKKKAAKNPAKSTKPLREDDA